MTGRDMNFKLKGRFLPVAEFEAAKQPRNGEKGRFQQILEYLLAHDGRFWQSEKLHSEADVRNLQHGFHASGTMRKLKRQGWTLETVSSERRLHIRLMRKPPKLVKRNGRNGSGVAVAS